MLDTLSSLNNRNYYYYHYCVVVALKDAFSEYDQDGNDRLSVSELGGVLRSIGLNPTQAEIDDIMENADSDGRFASAISLHFSSPLIVTVKPV